MSEQLTLFAEDTLASLSVIPGNALAKKTTVTSGQKCLCLSKNSGPLGSLENMLMDTLLWGSTLCLLTWKKRVTPQGRLLFQLLPSTPRTQRKRVFVVGNTKRGNINAEDARNGLPAAVKLWPTPQAADTRDRGNLSNPVIKNRVENGKQVNLSMCVSEVSGQLNPGWVENLMGFPIGWTDLDGQHQWD